jgi:glycosyltransferase involved in cell wall biosynthesis
MPRISFVTTTLNGALTLNRALTMARYAGADELCVCDNGSSDSTGAIIALHGAKSVRFEENRGPVVGMNAALELATGDYVFYHGDDDWLTDGALTRLADTLDQTPAAHFAYGGCKFWGLRSDVVLPAPFERDQFHRHMAAVGFAVLWRRDDTLRFRDVNPADWDFMLQMTEERQWAGVAVPEVTINYTLVAGRTWHDMKRNETALLGEFRTRWPMVTARAL